jgi:CHAT domain-containing protein
MPLHAAGIYATTDAQTNCSMDYVVSSYTPTLNSLLAAREQMRKHVPTKVLLIPNPEASLPSVKMECTIVESLVPSNSLITFNGLSPSSPEIKLTVKQALSTLSTASILHLACHGTQHANFPDESAFHLYDGKLTIAQIMGVELPLARFAFLSACSSATGDDEHPNESIHLAAALMAAGFCSVTGTMWCVLLHVVSLSVK